ncbi:MAG TPA: bifunctional glutamate N-acetyltransferase/amino-acid acetyltransferase ArgJ [Abditibacteriaceae bacterium]
MNQNENTIEFFDGGVASPQGFWAGSARAEIKTAGDDVALIVSEKPATAAAVFTRNAVKAAPVLLSAEHAQFHQARAIVANAGNANCCTGAQGMENARAMCEIVAREIGCDAREVLVCSTGIIGHALPMEKLAPIVEKLAKQSTDEIDRTASNEAVARAVMTTDTVPKFCAARAQIDGKTITVGGLAKGVGMIGPNMGPINADSLVGLHATMLSFLTTDAAVTKIHLQHLLERAIERSFNSVTVDGDTSTNDTAILLASGASDVEITDANEDAFLQLLEAVCVELSRKIARDGEGANHLVTIEVAGAKSEADAKAIALSVANSPLVKTAIFGRDPNWGRIAMAAGKAGVVFNPQKLDITLGEVPVFRAGEPVAFDQSAAEAALSGEEVLILISLGEGDAKWRAWTCDFSYGYVEINAEYHT